MGARWRRRREMRVGCPMLHPIGWATMEGTKVEIMRNTKNGWLGVAVVAECPVQTTLGRGGFTGGRCS